jgi:hypothetical protein
MPAKKTGSPSKLQEQDENVSVTFHLHGTETAADLSEVAGDNSRNFPCWHHREFREVSTPEEARSQRTLLRGGKSEGGCDIVRRLLLGRSPLVGRRMLARATSSSNGDQAVCPVALPGSSSACNSRIFCLASRFRSAAMHSRRTAWLFPLRT